MYTYPRPHNLAYPDRVLSSEGRFMRRSEAGQSESWPEGQPEGRCGAWGRASQARCREALGFRPARNWVCHYELAGRGQASGAKSPCSRTSTGVCQVPGRTDQGLKTLRRERRKASRGLWSPSVRGSCCGNCYQGAPFGAPSPLKEGERTKSPTRAAARERKRLAV